MDSWHAHKMNETRAFYSQLDPATRRLVDRLGGELFPWAMRDIDEEIVGKLETFLRDNPTMGIYLHHLNMWSFWHRFHKRLSTEMDKWSQIFVR
jgi:hypothetical protein